jgi:hypothetical protein
MIAYITVVSEYMFYAICCQAPIIDAIRHSVRILFRIVPKDLNIRTVPDPGKGVCADPVNGGAILGKGGPDPQGGNKERQLDPDKGRGKT